MHNVCKTLHKNCPFVDIIKKTNLRKKLFNYLIYNRLKKSLKKFFVLVHVMHILIIETKKKRGLKK